MAAVYGSLVKPFDKPAPPSKKKSSKPFKTNKAENLRHTAVNKRRMDEERQRIKGLVEGAGEPSSFLRWQKEMREKDQRELENMKCKPAERELSILEAAKARRRQIEQNQKTAKQQREESAQLMQIYAEKRLQEEKELRDLVRQVAEGHKNTKAAQQKLTKLKQHIVKEATEQNQQLLHKALEKAQAELIKKFKTMSEIRNIRSLPRMNMKAFDETETAGHGLLEEMSLAELQERLVRLKNQRKRDEEEKREHIRQQRLREKQQQQERLKALEAFNTRRRQLAKAAADSKTEEKAELEKMKQEQKQKRVEQLLEDRRRREIERNALKQATARRVRDTQEEKDTAQGLSWSELEQRLEQIVERL